MKNTCLQVLATFMVALSLACKTTLPAPSVAGHALEVPAPSSEIVPDVWVSVSSDGTTVYRLELKPDGTGTAGSMFLSTDPTMYRAEWTYDGGELQVDLVPVEGIGDVCHIDAALGGVVDGFKGSIRGSVGWEDDVVLYREKELCGRLDRLKAVMQGM